jgi:ketosteroid isomerase-like protein
MTQATIAGDEAGIRETMAVYNAALNGGKTAAVLPLYTEDGVFMPPYSQSAVGKSAAATAYDKVFAELQFDVKFTIAELVVMAPNWALCAPTLPARHSTAHSARSWRKPTRNFSSSKEATTANGAWPATASRRPTHPASEPRKASKQKR